MRGTVVQRGAKWSVVIDHGKDLSGKRRRSWHSGYTSREDAERARVEILRSLDTATFVEPSKMTVADFLGQWLPSRRADLRPGTYAAYQLHVDQYIVPRIGGVLLQKLTRTQVKALYADLAIAGGRAGRPLSSKTVHNVHVTLRKALADAVDDGLLVRNPAERAHTAGSDRPEMRTWSGQQLRVFLEHVAGDRLYACWRVLATTGIRRGEVLGLRWSDLDLDAGSASIVQQRVKGSEGVVYGSPKTAAGRRQVALDPRTVLALRAHRKAQAAEQLAWGGAYNDGGLVFCRENGAPIDPDGLTQRFNRHVKDARLPRIRLHDLRHTHATLALKAGVDVKVVSERLGHAGTTITRDTYQHVTPGMDAAVASMLADLVDGGGA